MIKVAVYDSGVGGLSIFQELRSACPDFELIFVSDNIAYPYGTKTEQELLQRVLAVSERIVSDFAPHALVLACNTASTVCLPSLRQRFDIPVVGVVPAIKPAALTTISKVIGVLATPATVQRPYTQDLIDQFASDCNVITMGSTELVDLAEAKLRGEPMPQTQLDTVLAPFLAEPTLDVLVLACTHFPIIKDEIGRTFQSHGKHVCLIDSGAAVARRVVELYNRGIFASQHAEALSRLPSYSAVFTKTLKSARLIENLKSLGIDRIKLINVN